MKEEQLFREFLNKNCQCNVDYATETLEEWLDELGTVAYTEDEDDEDEKDDTYNEKEDFKTQVTKAIEIFNNIDPDVFYTALALYDVAGYLKPNRTMCHNVSDICDNYETVYNEDWREEITEEVFSVSASLPEEVEITAAQLELDSDDEFEDDDILQDRINNVLSSEYGYCINSKYNYSKKYNENNEPSSVMITNIYWDTKE